ncbi:interferon-induced very large GTPase 1-like [Pimephales promelas]|nr:interferon-induced very large GTPase 1-like [Pimephales promelas]
MEVGTLVRIPDAPTAAPDQAGLYQIPVSIKGGTYQALVDSGCNQTSIHQSLIRSGALDKSRVVRVRCVHGVVESYPLMSVAVLFRGQKHSVEVAVNPRLQHPLILGTDWPGFAKLLGILCADASWETKQRGKTAVVQVGDAVPGPLGAAAGEERALERNLLSERDDFPLEQSQDETLKHAFGSVRSIDGQLLHPDQPLSYPYFCVIKDRLYRVTQDAQTKEDTTQLLVPRSRREMLFQAAHCNPMAGHLGQRATLNRLMARFFWPGIHENVRRWCASCRECQLVNPPANPKAPLCPLPLMQVPLKRIGMDLVGPLERSARGHRFALVLVDYATRYPEAVPLRNISAKSVASALFSLISRVGIPKEILTDQGTAFMSRTVRELYELLGIKSIRTSVYHPQTDGLVERFNRTLKTMIRKFVHEDAKNWDKWLEPLLFAVREVPQASTGFSPFELLFGRQPRGVLDVLRETWEDGPSASKNEIQYVLDLRTKLHTLGRLSLENLLQAQNRQKQQYNRGARLRQFSPGYKVLVLLPTSSSKLLAKWQGPFEVTRRVGDLNYEVIRTDRGGGRQTYHLNLLKKWVEAEAVMLATVVSGEEDLGPEARVKSQSFSLAPSGDHLSPSQLTDIKRVQAEFSDVFSPLPGRTNLIQHHVETDPGVVVRCRPYRLPEHKKKTVQAELETMLDMGVIEESNSDWASPIVLVPKPDGSVRFCVDYRKVNAVSKFDAYPMPRIDELLDRLGSARFYSTLDLTKGYWQIPLSPMSKEKTAFTTPFGLHQFVTLPFGLFGAPATFQRLMDRILRPHAAYAAAYLDDIIIYSNDWQRHMQYLRAVLKTLRRAGLTANPKKCAIGRVEVRYLGFHLGHGQVRPQIDKTAAVATCPSPKTKKEVRQFLGLAGYYRRFVPNYSDLASPLTDLTKKGAPDTVQWTEQCQQAFTQIKAALCGGPLLHAPDFSLPFILQTDASDKGLGAVLSQEVEGEERPVLYISRKLSKRETMYSTIEKECLAIRWAVLTLRYYLLGREFTLCSDHAPLQWLHRMKDTNARITRWYLALQPFKFQVVHRPESGGGVIGVERRLKPAQWEKNGKRERTGTCAAIERKECWRKQRELNQRGKSLIEVVLCCRETTGSIRAPLRIEVTRWRRARLSNRASVQGCGNHWKGESGANCFHEPDEEPRSGPHLALEACSGPDLGRNNVAMWDIMKRKLRDARPNTLDELKAAIEASWASITPKHCAFSDQDHTDEEDEPTVGSIRGSPFLFMLTGHTKFAPDSMFGLFKRKYRNSKVDCLADIENVVCKALNCVEDKWLGNKEGERSCKPDKGAYEKNCHPRKFKSSNMVPREAAGEQMATLQSPLTVTITLTVVTVAVVTGYAVTSTIAEAVVGAAAGAAAGVSILHSLWEAEARTRTVAVAVAVAVAGGLAGTTAAILLSLLGTQALTGSAVTGALAGAAIVAAGRTQLQWAINTIEWVRDYLKRVVDLLKRVKAALPAATLIGGSGIAAATIFKKISQTRAPGSAASESLAPESTGSAASGPAGVAGAEIGGLLGGIFAAGARTGINGSQQNGKSQTQSSVKTEGSPKTAETPKTEGSSKTEGSPKSEEPDSPENTENCVKGNSLRDQLTDVFEPNDPIKRENVSSNQENIKSEEIQLLFHRLHLHRNKLRAEDVLQITKHSLQSQESCAEEELSQTFIQKLLMMDYRVRYIHVNKANEQNQTQQRDTDVSKDIGDIFQVSVSNTGPSQSDDIHPMDVQMAVFYCADGFLKQLMVTKLSQCQYALPLLVPDPDKQQIEFPLWTFRQINKSWKMKNTNNEIISQTQPIYKVQTPVVCFFRFGSVSSSKSHLMNSLINEKHNTFFHRNCPGSSRTRVLMDGVVEIAWFCPSGSYDDKFTDCVAFCNLHGDAGDHEKQLQILTEMASVNVVLLPQLDRHDIHAEKIQNLFKITTPLICLITEDDSTLMKMKKGKFKISLKDRNQSDVSEELRRAINECLSESSSTFSLEDLSKHSDIRVDEEEDCRRGREAAQQMMSLLENKDLTEIKDSFLPHQGKLWHQWSQKNKELHRPEGHNTEMKTSEKKTEMKKIREQQYECDTGEFMMHFIKKNISHQEREGMFFLKWLRVLLDEHTSADLSDLHHKYDETWSSVVKLKEDHAKPEKLKAEQAELERTSEDLQSAGFGLEHIMREIGQIYESCSSVKKNKKDLQVHFSSLPSLAAEMMISGFPLELMDGDAAHVPLVWISAVIDELIQKLGDQKVFVLSVLGLQSSGKSTMLNAMFGLQFAVSAGRCTRGAFMQLIKVSDEMKTQMNFDYILVVDTEGLRALELTGRSTRHHDNELATFVVGLGNLTLINISGENPSEMQDILQIVVQAFLRMKKVNLSPSCVFVHQNVSDVTAGEKNMDGRRRLLEKLDEMTKLTAKEEVCDEECFRDVIRFDVQNDVKYFAQLWEGSPPMAPLNPKYCENIQELKEYIQTNASKSHELMLTHLKDRIKDLWEALLNERFVFSFRNSLEISAYRKLETEYSKWTWSLRSAMIETENKLHNKIENETIHEVEETDLQRELKKTREEVEKSMSEFFEKDRDKDILIHWKTSFEIKINDLQENILKETKRKLNEVLQQRDLKKKIDAQRTHQENTLYEKSKELALKLKDKANDEETLKKEFDLFWKQCVNNIKSDTPEIKEIDIMTDMREILSDINKSVSLDHWDDGKDIFSVPSFSDYVKVKKSSGFFTNVYRSAEKFVWGSPTKEDEVQIRALITDIDLHTDTEIQSFNISKMGYNKSCIQQLTGYIKARIVQHVEGSVRYEFKRQFFMDLVFSIFKRANKTITDQHRLFREASDPVIYLEKKREEYYSIFQKYCHGSTSAAIFGEIICQKLKEPIEQSVYKKTARDLTNEMRSNCESLNGNRSNLEKHILKTLAEEEDFDKYMNYIKTPRDHFKGFIRDEVKLYIDDKFSVSVLPEMKKNVELLQQKIMEAAHESTKHVQENKGDVGLWLKSFTQRLSDELIFSEKDLSGVKHDDVDVKLLEDVIKKELPDIISNISRGFTKTFPEKLDDKERPDELLIGHFCQCCWVQCPFCSAVCTNTIENHDGDHSVSFHRVDGVNGWKYHQTENLSADFCTTLVTSDKRFRVSDVWFPCKDYRSAGGVYAKWSITPDLSELSYWKWFVCRFQKHLEKYYKKTFQGHGKIPPEWRNHTRQDAIQSLDKCFVSK